MSDADRALFERARRVAGLAAEETAAVVLGLLEAIERRDRRIAVQKQLVLKMAEMRCDPAGEEDDHA